MNGSPPDNPGLPAPSERSLFGPDLSASKPWWQRYGDTPGWWHLAIVTALVLWFLEVATRPVAGHFGTLSAGYCLMPLILLWLLANYLVHLIALIVRRGRIQREGETRRIAGKWKWLITPLCLLTMFWAARSDLPSRFRFKLSQPALEAVARDVLAGKAVRAHRQIGLYWIDSIEKDRDGVFFQTGNDMVDACGLWYFGGSATDPLASGSRNLAPRWHPRAL